MAKLSAHGTEIARLVTSGTHTQRVYDVASDSWVEQPARYEYHFSFRSDGRILQRIVGLDVHPDESTPALRRHDWGWKLWSKLQDPKRDTARRQTALAHKMARNAESTGTLIDIKARPHA